MRRKVAVPIVAAPKLAARRMRGSSLILTVALVAAGAAHASPAVFPGQTPPAVQPAVTSPDLVAADQRLNQGDIGGARAAYLKVIDQAPSSPAAAQALSGVANTYVYERNYRGAFSYLEGVITHGTDPTVVSNARVAYTKISSNVDTAQRAAMKTYQDAKTAYDAVSWWNIFKIFEKFRLRSDMKNAQKDLDQVTDVKLMVNPVYLVLDAPAIDPAGGAGSASGGTVTGSSGGAIDANGANANASTANTNAANTNASNANASNANTVNANTTASTNAAASANANTSNANAGTATASNASSGTTSATANANTATAPANTNLSAANANNSNAANANASNNANATIVTSGNGSTTASQASDTAAATAAAERAKAVLVLGDELTRILALVPPDKREEARKIIVAGGGYQPADAALNPTGSNTATSAPAAPVTTGTASVKPAAATTATTGAAPTPNESPSAPPPPPATAVSADSLDALQQRVVEAYRTLQDRLKAGDRDGQSRAQNDYMMATMALRTKMAYMTNVRAAPPPAAPVSKPKPTASAAPAAPASTTTTGAAGSTIRVPPVVPVSGGNPAAPAPVSPLVPVNPGAPATSAPSSGAAPVNVSSGQGGKPISDDGMRSLRGGLQPQ